MKFNIHIFSCEKIWIHCVLVSCYGNARPYNPLCFVVNNNGATATNNTFLCDSKNYHFAGGWQKLSLCRRLTFCFGYNDCNVNKILLMSLVVYEWKINYYNKAMEQSQYHFLVLCFTKIPFKI